MIAKKIASSALFALGCAVFASGCTIRTRGHANAHAGAQAPQAAEAPGAPAQQAVQGWESLGGRWVNGRADRDSVFAARQGQFRQVMLRVSGSDLVMRDVVIHFGNGSTYSPPTQLVFDQGSRTRVIDLPGGDRKIVRIDFRYGNLPGGGRAHVEAFGR